MHRLRVAAIALLALAAAASCVLAAGAKFNRKVSVGIAAPAWKELPGVDDKQHALDDLKASTAVVLIFTCNHCPVSALYEDRLTKLAADFGPKKVAFVAINPSAAPTESLERMKRRADEKKLPYAYLRDVDQRTAKEYGATATPQVFLLDKDRKIAYMGAIDDNLNPAKVENESLRNALEAVLEGRKPEVVETRPFGCPIEIE